MRCTEMKELIALYIDDLLDGHIKNMLDKHLEECSECRDEYEILMNQINLCKQLPMIDLPEGFEDELHKGLLRVKEENKNLNHESNVEVLRLKKKNKKRNWKLFTSIAAMFIILIVGSAMIGHMKTGSEEEMSKEMITEESKIYAGQQPVAKQRMMASEPKLKIEDNNAELSMNDSTTFTLEGASENFGNNATVNGINERGIKKSSERKVIKNAFVYLDIENYDEKFNEIVKIIEVVGGYIENSNTNYKDYNAEKSLVNGNITIRIPEKHFIHILEKIKKIGIVTNLGIDGNDITQQYRDTVNEIENLKIQEKRLREIMNKAKSVKDVLEVEREFTRVRGQINQMTGNIKRWDDLTSLSTIEISLNEIIPKDKKIGPVNSNTIDQAKKAFIKTINHIMEFVEKSFIVFVSILPIVFIIGVIGIPVIWYIIKRTKK
ncbi:DUF4349 domain-containing protein [Marinisporobacter balticus]|uniref:Putative zinc finger protein n=1 Tax=Marinisporobacter balticus TaxID=2018667 RepID=A0A4R2KZA0_9FIRM|nr:DUF4349 domain-containing protein [Marinisporobacter balticus]TCO80011.1 putative zinc finger protein [Marinisporobacter balticus]